MGALNGVNNTLNTMAGNCFDAANAFIYLAKQQGVVAQMYRTFVNGIPHRIVNLPQFGARIDPSGIIGTGFHAGTALGSPTGAPLVNVVVTDHNIKECNV